MKNENISTLVLSGGGIRGICHCGVLKYLEQNNLHNDLKTLCGVSIGSIIGLMYVLKYTSKDIEEEILLKNFKTLKHIQPINIFSKFGIDSGDHLMLWIESQLIKRGLSLNITFRELYSWNPIVFKVGVTNLSKHQFEIFDKFTKPNLEVIKAIRISISVPFFFEYTQLDNCIYVDGGVLNNYPIELFNQNDNVLGVNLTSIQTGKTHTIDTFDSYIFNIMQCIMNKNNLCTERTIEIETNESVIDFDLSTNKKKQLIQIGYKSTENYFRKNKESE
jgi:NTE family protein